MLSRPKISPIKLSIIFSIFLVLVHNYPTTIAFYDLVSKNPVHGILFFVFCVFSITAIFNIVFIFLSIPYLMKPIFSFLLLCSSIISYGALKYRAVFNIDMVRNIFETHQSEAFSWINLSSALWFLITGILPSCFLFFVKTDTYPNIRQGAAARAYSILASLVLIASFYVAYKKEPIYIARLDPAVRNGIIPFSFFSEFSKYVYRRYIREEVPFSVVGTDAKRLARDDEKPVLMFFVIGESARAANFSMNGYDRETNLFTSKIENLLSYRDVRSCGTTTAISVPCIFSPAGRKDFDPEKTRRSEGLLDVLQKAGVNLLWKENNGNCYGACDRIPIHYSFAESINSKKLCYGKKECWDEIVLDGIDGEISHMQGSALIVFHLQGSHPIAYDKRHPEEYRFFVPECTNRDIGKCSPQEVVNSYDNSLIYTDSIIANMVAILKKHQDAYNTALLYVSDHGQSLGEGGFYTHGTPYDTAPDEQTHVPMQVWMSEGFIEDKKIDFECLSSNARTERYSHDNLFASLLGLWDIQTDAYDSTRDIFKRCRHQH